MSTHYTESEKYDLRKVGVNSIVEVDGKYYALFGPGISTANTSVSSRRLVDQYLLEKQILIERIESGALAVRGRVRPPLVETVAVIRADIRGDRLVLYSDSDGQLLLKSPPIS